MSNALDADSLESNSVSAVQLSWVLDLFNLLSFTFLLVVGYVMGLDLE